MNLPSVLRVSLTLALTGGIIAMAQAPEKMGAQKQPKAELSVTLGEHSKLTAKPAERDRIRAFYTDVLGCELSVRSTNLDSFQLGSSFNIGVVYEDSAPTEAESYKSIWLELQTDQPVELKNKVLSFGVKGIEYFDKKHFYFQAPGGQVFRIVQTGEVL